MNKHPVETNVSLDDGSIDAVLNKAVQVPATPEDIETELSGMVPGERHILAMAKPYMDNSRYAPFDLTQNSSRRPINDAMVLFNWVYSTYCDAQTKFNNVAKQRPAQVAALASEFVGVFLAKSIVRYMDFIVGDDDVQTEGVKSISLPVGAIGTIVYQFPSELRSSLWKNGQIDCTTIQMPERPKPGGRPAAGNGRRGGGGDSEEKDPDTKYFADLLVALLKIMSLRPKDMITFLMTGEALRRLRREEDSQLDADTKRLLQDRPRMELACVVYAGLEQERDIADHSACFSMVSATRIFFRCLQDNCAIFDRRSGKRIRSMEEFMAVLFTDDLKPPQFDSIREAHDQWAIVCDELETRLKLAGSLDDKNLTLEERLMVQRELAFRTRLGSVSQLLATTRRCAAVIRGELGASYSTTGAPVFGENGMRYQWRQFQTHVNEQVLPKHGDTLPLFSRICRWFLRWQDRAIAHPSGMAAVKSDPFRGRDFQQSRAHCTSVYHRDNAISKFMGRPGCFRQRFDEHYRLCHNSMNLLAWPFDPVMEDVPKVRSMLHRIFFPTDGFYVFDARCEAGLLCASDDMLLVLTKIAERAGAQCNAPEAARFLQAALESNVMSGDRRYILICGSPAAGKSTILTLCTKIVGDGRVNGSQTAGAINYIANNLMASFNDEDSRFKTDLSGDTDARVFALMATQPHKGNDSEQGTAFKNSTAVSNMRLVTTPVAKQSRGRNGAVTVANKMEVKEYKGCHPANELGGTNSVPVGVPRAILDRISWWLFPDGAGSRFASASRAILGNPDNSDDIAYLRALFALIFFAAHWRECGAPSHPIISAVAIQSALCGITYSPATDDASPSTDIALARWYRRAVAQENRLSTRSDPVSSSSSSGLDPFAKTKGRVSGGPTSSHSNGLAKPLISNDLNTAIYTSFARCLDECKTSFPARFTRKHQNAGDDYVRFTQQQVDEVLREFNMYLPGVKAACPSEGVGSGRTDSEMNREIRGRAITGFVRSAIEHNHSGNSFDHYDPMAAYIWMGVPADPDSVLNVVKGLQTAAFRQPGMVQAARSVISLVLCALTISPDSVEFDTKSGYITLHGFFSAVDERENGDDDDGGDGGGETKGTLYPGPNASELAGTRYVLNASRKPTKPRGAKRSSSASSSSGPGNKSVDYEAVLKSLQEKNPKQMNHIKKFNSFCEQRYHCPEVPDNFGTSFRLMLMRLQGSNVEGFGPFIGRMGLGPEAENKIQIHASLFGFPFHTEQSLNLLLHSVRGTHRTLTYDVDATEWRREYKRSLVALEIRGRRPDPAGFPRGSAYRNEQAPSAFAGLFGDHEQEKVRKVFTGDTDEGFDINDSTGRYGPLFTFEATLLCDQFDQFNESLNMADDLNGFANGHSSGDHLGSNGDVIDITGEAPLPHRKQGPDATTNTNTNTGIGDDPADGVFVRLKQLIDGADIASLQFAYEMIQNPGRKGPVIDLENGTSDPYQVTGYRIAKLVQDAHGCNGRTHKTLDYIDIKIKEREAGNLQGANILDRHLRRMSAFVKRIDARDLTDLRIVDGELVSAGGQETTEPKDKGEHKKQVLFEPTTHLDFRLAAAHIDLQQYGSSAVYAGTSQWAKEGMPMSLEVVNQETTAVSSQMLGYEFQSSHFTNNEQMQRKTILFARIKSAAKILGPLITFAATLSETNDRGELCYFNQVATEGFGQMMAASAYRKLLRGMLLDFLELMVLFTRTTGLQSPYVCPSLVLYQAMQLGIVWMHSQVMTIAMELYGSVDPEQIRATYVPKLDDWLGRVIAIADFDRRTIIESRILEYGSVDYLCGNGARDPKTLMFFPLPGDETPNRETIKQVFVFTRQDTKSTVNQASGLPVYQFDPVAVETKAMAALNEHVLPPPKRRQDRRKKRQDLDVSDLEFEAAPTTEHKTSTKRKEPSLTLEKVWRLDGDVAASAESPRKKEKLASAESHEKENRPKIVITEEDLFGI